jgi:hypothetical protein
LDLLKRHSKLISECGLRQSSCFSIDSDSLANFNIDVIR